MPDQGSADTHWSVVGTTGCRGSRLRVACALQAVAAFLSPVCSELCSQLELTGRLLLIPGILIVLDSRFSSWLQDPSAFQGREFLFMNDGGCSPLNPWAPKMSSVLLRALFGDWSFKQKL